MNYLTWAIRLTVVQLIVAMGGSLAAGGLTFNVGVFVLGLWALHSDKVDPVLVYVATLLISLVYDWVWLGVYAENIIDLTGSSKYVRTEEFSLAMTIIGHIMKPLTIAFSYFVFRERGGDIPFNQSDSSNTNSGSYHAEQTPSAPPADGQYSSFA
eukprot:TRINITY_DN18968_c0_g1_i1.p1 TRINITY_DN18968_c0_g1~~TRINITY_DN18968_c0_g1_i1.p1  ORF type:complete len:155 (-),score=31.92 TRINITY_DN18968_c0_g1_i1:264-728(-)